MVTIWLRPLIFVCNKHFLLAQGSSASDCLDLFLPVSVLFKIRTKYNYSNNYIIRHTNITWFIFHWLDSSFPWYGNSILIHSKTTSLENGYWNDFFAISWSSFIEPEYDQNDTMMMLCRDIIALSDLNQKI